MSGAVPTNFLEVRFYGLQRSGNHAVIDWVLDQHRGQRMCFLNNVRHGDYDPYTTARQTSSLGFREGDDRESLRSSPKHLLVYSYEDDEAKMQAGRTFFASAKDPDFERERASYIGASEHSLEFIVLRDPFNFFASRLKRLHTLTGSKDLAQIKHNWMVLAKQAIASDRDPRAPTLINYNRWFTDRPYRVQLSQQLHGRFSDATLKNVSPYGKGSSFDAKEYDRLTWPLIRQKWRRALDPTVYRRADYYLRKIYRMARGRGAQNMKVLERWQEMRGHPMFRAVAADGELLELSERIFGELAGTGDFVAECTGMRAAGSPARRHAGRRDSSTRISQS